MNKKRILTIAAAAAVLGTVAIVAAPSFADGRGSGWGYGHGHGYGHGWMMGQGGYGPGHGRGAMMGQGGYGPGYGHGAMMGRGYGPDDCPVHGEASAAIDRDLSLEDVAKMVERHVELTGNERLKVGKVEKKDETTYLAEIVTKDDSLVSRFEIDRKTGSVRRAK